jgi:phosphate transport system substrate-binding protein
VKLNRIGVSVSLLAAGALALSACGSDNNAASGGSTGASSSKSDCGGKKTLKASGSTAQSNAMTRFVNAYEQACPGYTLNYTSNGSGAGISEFVGKQTDFGGSDSPLNAAKGEYDKAKARCGSDAWNLPVVFGPIAITYNVKGVTSLNLDGPTAAKIFNGGITAWNDPALQALNAGVSLPSRFMSCSAATYPERRTTSRNIWIPLPAGCGVRVPGRRSTAASARAPWVTTAPPRPSSAPKGQSPTTNGRSLRRNT